jgi:MATE family multidrug resistance protein
VPTRVEDAPLVEGSLWKAIWLMSWPLTLTTVAGSIVGMIDVQVAGLIGSVSQAAVGLAEQVIFLFMIFLMSLGVGTTAIVSRAFGERDLKQTNFATGQSLSLSILSGVVLMIAAFFTARYLMPLFSKSPQVVAEGDLYLTIFALYLVPFSLVCISNSAFRAVGNAKIPLLVVSIEVIVNIIGDYLTVVYNWPVPGLGIRGIAWSAVVGAIIGATSAIICIRRSVLSGCANHLMPLDKEALLRVLKVGLPAAFQRLGWAASVFVVFFILSRLKEPTAALASWTIGMRVEALLFMPLMALSLAVSSIVGQNLGAKQIDRAFRAGWHVTWIGVGMMFVLATLMFLFAEPIAARMSHDPETIKITADYLRINALAEPFLAVNMILSGALQGAGDTKITMWISIFGNWVVRLPLAWYLAMIAGYNATGAWIAMSASVVVSSLMIAWRFQSGVWTKQKV